eukprot:CAMPEP_0177591760 /NCGR_PEP_ID=MMETSP0419_2-20121207/8178_1 /TAXON_ID=582737 /ORGANISM="Tetraselmis sp., Strain GSL018" /LENGTH=200 /DNA_ID=CAMNT_0019082541 /DNA_START=548 /DNA_END=1146 /DNA_ORIENTATION=-
MPNYGTRSFWDAYYTENLQKTRQEEWLCTKRELDGWLEKVIGPKLSVLVIGCGLSDLAEQIYDEDECRDITCVDWSRPLIARKAEENSRARAGLQYHAADMTSPVSFKHFGFDLILDKGLFDCVMCRSDAADAARMLVHNAHQLLRPEGRYVVISSAPPDERLPLLSDLGGADLAEWAGTEARPLNRSGCPRNPPDAPPS